MISSTKNEEMSSGNDEKEKQRQSRRQTEFSLCIAKISQGLRKFRNHSENFAMHIFFAKLAKFRYHSENYCA